MFQTRVKNFPITITSVLLSHTMQHKEIPSFSVATYAKVNSILEYYAERQLCHYALRRCSCDITRNFVHFCYINLCRALPNFNKTLEIYLHLSLFLSEFTAIQAAARIKGNKCEILIMKPQLITKILN